MYVVRLIDGNLPDRQVIYKYENGEQCRKFIEDIYHIKNVAHKNPLNRWNDEFLYDKLNFYMDVIRAKPEILTDFFEQMTARKEEYIFISSETGNDIGYALSKVYAPILKKIRGLNAADYGDELDSIGIIMICVRKELLNSGFGGERRYISWKRRYADIRLQIDFDLFCKADSYTRQLLVVQNIIESIWVIQRRSKNGFQGEKLIKDILDRIGLSTDEVDSLRK